jgi:carboxypeptidase family protein
MKDAKCRFFLLLLFLAWTCVGAVAQANSSVTGMITDPTGAVVPGATVELMDPATGVTRSALSDASGLYAIAGLNAGKYDMKVTANGFETYTNRGIVVNISATFRVDVNLVVGSTSQTVTVAASALTVQTDSNVVSTLISEQQITELATNGRNVVSLATLGMGVSGNLPAMENPFSVNANYAISFNGLNQAHNIWVIDGGEAYDRGSGGKMSVMPSQDALGEFQVLSSNYAPDYGYASGGAITMSIKNGTSQFHGGAWEFDRNDALDAHDYFDNNNGQHAPKAELRYNIFGANLGGPFFIPNHYNSARKNKTFFFYNEEWRKMVNGVPTSPISTLPAADEVTSATAFTYTLPTYDAAPAAFVPTVSPNSAIGKAILADGLTMGQPFPNNRIPANLLDSNALLFNTLKNLPAATNTANDTYTPTGGHLPINVREELFRVDHNINDKWALLGHFIHDANDSVQATPEWQGDNFPTVGSNFSNPSYSAVIKLTGSLRPDVLLEAAFNYDGNKIAIIPTAAGGGSFVKPSGWSTGTYFPAANDAGNRLPDITLQTVPNGSSSSEWGPGNDPWTNGAEDFAESAGISITRGKHNLKFGGGYNRYTKNQVIGKDSEGDYTFNDGWNPTTKTPVGQLTGDSYLDFLLGLATNFSQANANPVNHYVNNTISVYAMDNWHVTSRLSLQLGVRYDAMPHVWERNNQVSNFEPSLYQPALAPTFDSSSGAFCTTTDTSNGCTGANSPGLQIFSFNGVQTPFYMNGVAIAGQNGVPRALAKNDYNTIMPRVGFSYDLLGNGRTVLRVGFGTFYERIQGNDVYDAAGAPPFISTPSANDVEFTSPTTNWLTGGTAASPSFPQGYNSLNTHYPDPGVAEFSLGVQHQILPALILTTQYVGNAEWDQNVWIPINNFPLSTPLATRQAYAAGKLTAAQVSSDATYPGFGNIRLQSNPATGTYNSLQAGLRQENKWGLSYGVYYTWSHQIDSTPGSVDVDNNNPSYNPWNLKYDKGSGALDRRHILNINYEYRLPFFARANGLAHSLLGGWELAGTVLTESGLPWFGGYAPKNSYGDTVGLGGDYASRPNLTGKPQYTKTRTAAGYQYVSNAGFSAPLAAWNGGPSLGFGNSGKDAVVGAGNTDFTTSIYKTFSFSERAKFEFRAESFNTFNHTQFNGLSSTNPQSSSFGITNSDLAPRQLELGGKITF